MNTTSSTKAEIAGTSEPGDGLDYGPASRPPLGPLAALTLQHAAMVMVFMVYPLVLAGALGLASAETSGLIAGTLFACALATWIQVMPAPWGSGQLGVYIPTPVHLSALIYAGSVGGVPLIAGFALLLCLCELDQLVLLDAADPDGGPCERDFLPAGSVAEAWRDRVREALGGERGAYGRATRTLKAAAQRFARARVDAAAGGGQGGNGSKL